MSASLIASIILASGQTLPSNPSIQVLLETTVFSFNSTVAIGGHEAIAELAPTKRGTNDPVVWRTVRGHRTWTQSAVFAGTGSSYVNNLLCNGVTRFKISGANIPNNITVAKVDIYAYRNETGLLGISPEDWDPDYFITEATVPHRFLQKGYYLEGPAESGQLLVRQTKSAWTNSKWEKVDTFSNVSMFRDSNGDFTYVIPFNTSGSTRGISLFASPYTRSQADASYDVREGFDIKFISFE